MDPAPQAHPILSYVLSRIPTLSKTKPSPGGDVDIEQPHAPQTPSPRSPSLGEFELVERMPGLRHPSVLRAMSRAVADVSAARSALQDLGPRPDHELVDSSRALIAAASTAGDGAQRIIEADLEACRTVVKLEETHDAYEALLHEAEGRLEKVYRSAMEGKDLEEAEGKDDESAAGAEAGDAAAQEEVVAVLKQAEEGKAVESVRLVDRKLRYLPEAFGKIQGIRVLDVSHNQLEVIPDAIGALEHLEELRLASNALVSLPDTVGLLSNLKILDVSTNKLRTLPDSISKCRSLVELNASYNGLTYLPTNIGYELVNLQRLWVHMNKLRSFPSSICEMQSLYLLDAHFNELCGLPSALSSLEILNLSSNFSDMKELPFSFGDLLNLRELDLSNNQIHALPDSFGRLDKLEKLNLEQNPLAMPPAEIVNQGVETVKEYMSKKWLDALLEEEQKSLAAAAAAESPQASTPKAWLARSVSWVSDVSGSLVGYVSGGQNKSEKDAILDQQF